MKQLKHLQHYLGLFLLGASLVTPTAVKAASIAPSQGEERHERRFYDREHHDWHNWDDREAAAYRHWLMEERHERQYREYVRLRRRQQAEYWRWRHEHPDWR